MAELEKLLSTDSKVESLKKINAIIEKGGGGTGLQMFDTILKDHILTYEESKGLALQGTYVYKDAVAGSRYGYADFYNKVVEEYQNSSNGQVYVKPNITAVGNIVDNKGVLTGFSGNTNYVNIPVTTPSNSFELVIKTQTPSTLSNNSVIQASTQYKGIILRVLSATSTKVWLSSNGTSWDVCNGLETNLDVPTNATVWFKISWDGALYSFAISTDGNTWTQGVTVSNTNPIYWTNALQGLGGCSWESYPWTNGSIDLNESYLDIDGERWWDGAEYLHCKKNSNGHIFYDIAEKGKADEIFASIGTAWFYGVDTENERVFLPRKSLLELTTESKIPVIGNGNGLGLATSTDTSKYYPIAERDGDDSEIFTHTARTSAIAMGTSIGNATGGVANGLAIGVSTNPDFSGLTTDLTSVIAEQTEKYLYICVGNSESVSSVTDVVEVTTTENDTTPLFTGMYFDFTPNNVSWLKGGEQKNSEGVYTFCYNELVNELTTPKYGLKVIETKDMIAGVDYSEYWKINQDDMTFTTPSVAGLFPNNRILVAKKEPTDIDPTWYNLYSDGWLEQGGQIVPNGVNHDVIITFLKPFADTNYMFGKTNNNNYTNNYQAKYLNNGFDYTVNSVTVGVANEELGNNRWQACGYAEIPTVSEYTENVNLYFKVANAVQNLELLDAGEVLESLADKISRQDCKAYITETYVNGASWYRIYSDGWCEQGGALGVGGQSISVTLLKTYVDTTYNLTTSCNGAVNPKTVSDFVIDVNYGDTEKQGFEWRACGYLA